MAGFCIGEDWSIERQLSYILCRPWLGAIRAAVLRVEFLMLTGGLAGLCGRFMPR